MEDDERPIDAARRELKEETGIAGEWVLDRQAPVHRDAMWAGRRYVGEEEFFLARIDQHQPLVRDGLGDEEASLLVDQAWILWSEIDHLADAVEPPEILDVLRGLDPSGPWAAGRAN